MTSASPRRIARADSPSVCPLVAHAEAMLMLGPRQFEEDGQLAGEDVGRRLQDEEGRDLAEAADPPGLVHGDDLGSPPRPTPRLTPIRSGPERFPDGSSPEST
jgi:hypothetical protein